MTAPARLVIAFVGLAVLLALGAIAVLAVRETPIPSELGSVPLAGITGLLGLLVNTKNTDPST